MSEKKTESAKITLQGQRQADAAAAMAEYRAAKAAELEKTARLRALRLAKAAADRDAKPATNKPKPTKRR